MPIATNTPSSVSSDAAASRVHAALPIVLWVMQVLLAALFVSTGRMKLIVPAAVMAKMSPMPVPFVRFLGVAEVLGAVGLLLPGLLRRHTELTPLAAAGLTVIMVGAVVVTAHSGMVLLAGFPLVVGLFTGFVAWARWRMAPLPGRR